MCDTAQFAYRTIEVLSSLCLIPSIYIIFKDKQYTEALITAFSMIASLLYHSCNVANDQYGNCISICLLKDKVGFYLDDNLAFLLIIVVFVYRAPLHKASSILSRILFDRGFAYTVTLLTVGTSFVSYHTVWGTNTDSQTVVTTYVVAFIALFLFLWRVIVLNKDTTSMDNALWYAAIAFISGVIAVTFRDIQFTYGGLYALFHALWHVFGSGWYFFSIYYIIMSRDDEEQE